MMAHDPEGVEHTEQTPAPKRTVEEEDLGPAPELLKAAIAEAGAEATGAEEFFEAEEELGVQHEGIGAAQILGFIFAIVAVIAMAIVFIFFILEGEVRAVQDEFAEAVNYPELREAELNADRLLGQYEILDEEAGVYRIPIDRAMEVMANEAYAEQGRAYSPELQLLPGN